MSISLLRSVRAKKISVDGAVWFYLQKDIYFENSSDVIRRQLKPGLSNGVCEKYSGAFGIRKWATSLQIRKLDSWYSSYTRNKDESRL